MIRLWCISLKKFRCYLRFLISLTQWNILWTLHLKNYKAEIDKTKYSVARLRNLELIRFWCISLKKFRCYLSFLISLTQWYRTKLRAIVPNRNYFKPIILKFKTFIYNSGSKIIYNCCIYGGNTPPVGGSNPSPSPPRGLVFSEITHENVQN